MTRRLVLAFALAVLVGACSNDSPAGRTSVVETSAAPTTTGAPDAPPAVQPNGIVVQVQAIDNTFRPETIEITVGTEVHWTNVGRNEHNIVPVDGGDWGIDTVDFAPKAEYSHVFTEPGTFAYYCTIHGTSTFGMVGTVVVTA